VIGLAAKFQFSAGSTPNTVHQCSTSRKARGPYSNLDVRLGAVGRAGITRSEVWSEVWSEVPLEVLLELLSRVQSKARSEVGSEWGEGHSLKGAVEQNAGGDAEQAVPLKRRTTRQNIN